MSWASRVVDVQIPSAVRQSTGHTAPRETPPYFICAAATPNAPPATTARRTTVSVPLSALSMARCDVQGRCFGDTALTHWEAKTSGVKWSCSRNRFTNQEAFGSHPDAAVTPRARLRLARLVVDGWPPSVAAKTPLPVVQQIVTPRWRRKLGPVQIASELGPAPPTVHAVLVHCRLDRLSRTDRVTGEPIRRYEHDQPGSLIHGDVTKFGNIPNGGGHRFFGRGQGTRNRHGTPGVTRTDDHQPRLGVGYPHAVIDDHSRVPHVEMHADERPETAIGVLHRATAWFGERGVTVERVPSDNGSAYRPYAWQDACAGLGIRHKHARCHRPQTNVTIERFHRTLAAGRACTRRPNWAAPPARSRSATETSAETSPRGTP